MLLLKSINANLNTKASSELFRYLFDYVNMRIVVHNCPSMVNITPIYSRGYYRSSTRHGTIIQYPYAPRSVDNVIVSARRVSIVGCTSSRYRRPHRSSCHRCPQIRQGWKFRPQRVGYHFLHLLLHCPEQFEER